MNFKTEIKTTYNNIPAEDYFNGVCPQYQSKKIGIRSSYKKVFYFDLTRKGQFNLFSWSIFNEDNLSTLSETEREQLQLLHNRLEEIPYITMIKANIKKNDSDYKINTYFMRLLF